MAPDIINDLLNLEVPVVKQKYSYSKFLQMFCFRCFVKYLFLSFQSERIAGGP